MHSNDIEAKLANPLMMKAVSSPSIKNDRNARRMHPNRAIVIANKMMIIWHMLTKKQMYMQKKDILYKRNLIRCAG